MTRRAPDAPPRIVLVTHDFPKVSETFIVQKFLGLLDAGVDVWLFADRIHADAWHRFPDLAANASARRRVRGWPERSGAAFVRAVAGQLLGSALSRPASTVRCFARELAAFGPAGLRRAIFALPVVALEPDLVHLEFGTEAANRIDLADATGAPVTASFRGYDLNIYGLDDPDTYTAVWPRLAGVHFLGRDLERRARSRGYRGGLPTALIAPAVDTARFHPREPDGDGAAGEDGIVRILSVGRLHWKKGYEFALHALRLLADRGVAFEYRIVGDGPFADAVRACIDDLGLGSSVTLVGAVDHSSVVQELHRSDLFLHAAVSEGFCNAVLEAQAMTLPVVCSDADGLPENVEDGVTGLVVPRRDPAAMADALEALARDPARRRRMGNAGRRRVTEHFDPHRQIEQFVAFFDAVLGRPVRPPVGEVAP